MNFPKTGAKTNALLLKYKEEERSFDQVISMSKDHAGENKSQLDVVIRLGLTLECGPFFRFGKRSSHF